MAAELVARAAELDALRSIARGGAEGLGAVAHLVGEAGIGKTSLLEAVRVELDRAGTTTRHAEAEEIGYRRPMALVRSLLGDMASIDEADPAGRAVAAVEALAATGYVVFFVDDLHWADDASLAVLRAVARRAAVLGLALITAARPVVASSALHRYVDLVASEGRIIELPPLDRDAQRELARRQLGRDPGRHLRELVDGAAGNPFIAIELLRGLAEEGALEARGDEIDVRTPGAVPETTLARLARRAFSAFPDGDLWLRAAAVLPDGFTPEELGALLDRPVAAAIEVAVAACDARLWLDRDGRLGFRHDLLRRAVLDATPASAVRALHRRTVEVLMARNAPVERYASSLLSASDPNDAAGVDRLLTAGMAAKDRSPALAADLLARALDTLAPDDPRVPAAALALGWALADSGRLREVQALLDRRFARGAGNHELHRLRSFSLIVGGRIDQANAYALDAQAEWPAADDVRERAEAMAELAVLAVLSAQPEEATRWLERAEAEPAPSPTGVVYMWVARSWVHGLRGAYEAAIAAAREAVAAADADPTGHGARVRPKPTLAVMLDAAGKGAAALDVLRHAQRDAVPIWTVPMLHFSITVTRFRLGEWDDALAEAEAGLLGAEETDVELGSGWACAVGALITVARGSTADARRWLQRSQLLGGVGTDWLLHATAIVQSLEGDDEGAASLLGLLTARALDSGAYWLLSNSGIDTIRCSIATDRPETVARVAGGLEALAAATSTPVAHAQRAWATGLQARDDEPIERAAAQLAACGRPYDATRAWHDAALAAAARGAPDRARSLARHTFAGYDELGAGTWFAQLRAGLREHGIAMRPRRSQPRATAGWDSLTPTEQTVVELVSDGMTNTAIAQRLFVSRRTVESHLVRVYTKLGLRTRTQLVSEALRRSAGSPAGGGGGVA